MHSTHELAQDLLAGPDVPVIMQKDGEGNSYSPFGGMRLGYYRPHNDWDGWAYDDSRDDTTLCVVVQPIN